MDSAAYQRAIADVVAQAAAAGIVERSVRLGGRGRPADLSDPGEAAYLVHLLTTVPDHRVRRLWMACEGLMDELGVCVLHARRQARAEDLVELGTAHLERLRQRTRPAVRAGP